MLDPMMSQMGGQMGGQMGPPPGPPMGGLPGQSPMIDAMGLSGAPFGMESPEPQDDAISAMLDALLGPASNGQPTGGDQAFSVLAQHGGLTQPDMGGEADLGALLPLLLGGGIGGGMGGGMPGGMGGAPAPGGPPMAGPGMMGGGGY